MENLQFKTKITSVSLDEEELTGEEILAVTRNFASVDPLSGRKREKTEQLRKFIEQEWFSDGAPPRYGFNTGIGSLKGVRISQEQIDKFQESYIKAHCAGVGDPFDIEIVRGAMLLQANALSKGFSGIRAIVVDKLIEMLNKRIHPVVPSQGSLGASGDLAPLAHIASVLVGEDQAEVWMQDKKIKVKDLKNSDGILVFDRNGESTAFQPLRLKGKEAISLTNATSVMLSIAVHLIYDAGLVIRNADISASLALEAIMAEKDAFADELHQLRNQAGQISTAANIRKLTEGSQRMTPEARIAFFEQTISRTLEEKLKESDSLDNIKLISAFKRKHEFEESRVQDAYSMRCAPQVHGTCKDAYNYVKSIVERELQAVTDNPVIFQRDGHYVSRSGGNFHGEPLAMAMDFLAIALSEIGSIAERRMFRLLSPHMSFGLPRNLSGGQVGVNSGLMIVQYCAAQLVSENKVLAHPACVDTVPTSDNQEDHVSMGMIAARKARSVLKNVQNLIAMEYLCAVQGIHLSANGKHVSLAIYPLGKGTDAAFSYISSHLDSDGKEPFGLMGDDEYLHCKVSLLRDLSSGGEIILEVEKLFRLLI